MPFIETFQQTSHVEDKKWVYSWFIASKYSSLPKTTQDKNKLQMYMLKSVVLAFLQIANIEG